MGFYLDPGNCSCIALISYIPVTLKTCIHHIHVNNLGQFVPQGSLSVRTGPHLLQQFQWREVEGLAAIGQWLGE